MATGFGTFFFNGLESDSLTYGLVLVNTTLTNMSDVKFGGTLKSGDQSSFFYGETGSSAQANFVFSTFSNADVLGSLTLTYSTCSGWSSGPIRANYVDPMVGSTGPQYVYPYIWLGTAQSSDGNTTWDTAYVWFIQTSNKFHGPFQ